MKPLLSRRLTKKLQQVFWVYLTKNGIVTSMSDFVIVNPKTRCSFIPITPDNCSRVQEFREPDRISEYRNKIDNKEVGFFAECDGKVVGSIWASINRTQSAIVVRGYMKLKPHEAVMHDGVTSEKRRGMGIGAFMVGALASILLKDYQVKTIVLDVNVRNAPSLRMLAKTGVEIKQKVLYVSAFGTLLFQKVLRHY
jgi:ribosomal protein S18 acetylase RimI-like enzyme